MSSASDHDDLYDDIRDNDNDIPATKPTTSSDDTDDNDVEEPTPTTPVSVATVQTGGAQMVERKARPAAGARKLAPIESLDGLETLLMYLNASDHERVYAGVDAFARQIRSEYSMSDQKATLLARYCTSSPEWRELFTILDGTESRSFRIASRTMDVFAAGLSTAAMSSWTSGNQARTIIRRLLKMKMKLFYRLLAAEDLRVVAAPLRLLVSIAQHGVPLAKELIGKFNFAFKPFLKLPFRAYTKNNDQHVEQARQTRQLFVDFAITLLRHGDGELVQTVLAIKGFVSSFLKNLAQDDMESATNVFGVLRTQVVESPYVSAQIKAEFFNSYVLEQLVKFYESDEAHAELVHSFFVDLVLKSPGLKVDTTSTAAVTVTTSSNTSVTTVGTVGTRNTGRTRLPSSGQLWKHHRGTLLRLLSKLRANEDARQQSLVLTILTSWPRLTRPYLRSMPYTYEPRPSYRWLANVHLLIKLYRLPIRRSFTAASTHTGRGRHHKGGGASVPRVTHDTIITGDAVTSSTISGTNGAAQTAIEHLVPSSLTVLALSHGLQHGHLLVKYTTLKLMHAMFQRYAQLLSSAIANASSSSPSSGSSSSVAAINASFREILRRHVPDLHVVFQLRGLLSPDSPSSVSPLSLFPATLTLPEDENDELPGGIINAASSSSSSSSSSKRGATESKIDTAAAIAADARLSASDRAARQTVRSVMYMRWLSLLEAYATYLPELVLESRIDLWLLLTPRQVLSLPLSSQYQLVSLVRACGVTNPRLWSHVRTKGDKIVAGTNKRIKTEGGDDETMDDKDNTTTTTDGVLPQTYFGSLLLLYVTMRQRALAGASTTVANNSIVGDDEGATRTAREVLDMIRELLLDILVATPLFTAQGDMITTTSNNDTANAAHTAARSLACAGEVIIWLEQLSSATIPAFEQLVARTVVNPFLLATKDTASSSSSSSSMNRVLSPLVMGLLERRDRGAGQPWLVWLGSGTNAEAACPLLGYICAVVSRLLRVVQQPVALASLVNASLGPLYASATSVTDSKQAITTASVAGSRKRKDTDGAGAPSAASSSSSRLMTVDDQSRLGALLRLAITIAGGAPIESKTTSQVGDDKLKQLKRLSAPAPDQLGSLAYMRTSAACEAALLALPVPLLDSVLPTLADKWQQVSWSPLADFFFAAGTGHPLFALPTVKAALPIADEPAAATATSESKAVATTSTKKKSMKGTAATAATPAAPVAASSSMLSFLHSLPLPLLLAHMSESRNGDLQLLEDNDRIKFVRTSLTRLSPRDTGLALRCLCSTLVTFLDLHAAEGAAAMAASPASQRAIMECLCACIEDLVLARVNGVPTNTLSAAQLAAHLSLVLSATSSASSTIGGSTTSRTLLDWFLMPASSGAASFLSSAVTDSFTYLLACMPLSDVTVKAVAQPLLDKVIVAAQMAVTSVTDANTTELPPPFALLRLFIAHFTPTQLASVAASVFTGTRVVASSPSRTLDASVPATMVVTSSSPQCIPLVTCIARHHQLAVALFTCQPLAAVSLLTSLIQQSSSSSSSSSTSDERASKKSKSKKDTTSSVAAPVPINESFDGLLLDLLRSVVSQPSSIMAANGLDVICTINDTFIHYCLQHITIVRGQILALLLTTSQSMHYITLVINHLVTTILNDLSVTNVTDITLRGMLPVISALITFVRTYVNPSSTMGSVAYPAAYAPPSTDTPSPWSATVQDGLCELVKQRVIPLVIAATDEDEAQHRVVYDAAVTVIRHLVELGAISDKRRVKLMRKIFGDSDSDSNDDDTSKKKKSKRDKDGSNGNGNTSETKKAAPSSLTSVTIDVYASLLAGQGRTEGRALFLLQSLVTLASMYKKSSSDGTPSSAETRLMGHVMRIFSPSSPSITNDKNDDSKRSGATSEYDMSSLYTSSGMHSGIWIKAINKFIVATLKSRLLHAPSLQLLNVILRVYYNGPIKTAAPTPDSSSSSTDGQVTPAKTIFDMILSHSMFINAIRPPSSAPIVDTPAVSVPNDEDDNDDEHESKDTTATSGSLSATDDTAASTAHQTRTQLIRLLYVLLSAPIHAPAVDMDTHANLLQVILAGYNGTMSECDRLVRRIMTIFERVAIIQQRRAEGHDDTDNMNKDINDVTTDSGLIISCRRRWGSAARRELEIRLAGGSVTNWGEREVVDGTSTSWIFTNMDSSLLAKGPDVNGVTCDEESSATAVTTVIDVTRYDASFILPFLLSYMSEASQLDCRHMVKCGALSYIILGMSSSSLMIRRAAYAAITRFFTLLERFAKPNDSNALQEGAIIEDRIEGGGEDEEDPREGGAGIDETDGAVDEATREWDEADLSSVHPSRRAAMTGGKSSNGNNTTNGGDAPTTPRYTSAAVAGGVTGFREQPQIAVLLTALRNAITTPFQRLPLLTTSFVGRALNVLLLADHKLYKPLNRFIIQRPALDLTDVPMFYGLFNSGTADYRLHRSFILRLILDGLHDEHDNAMLERRHVWPLLLSFHDSRMADHFTRALVLQIIGRGVTLPSSLIPLLHRHGLLAWLRAHIADGRAPLPVLRPLLELTRDILQQIHRVYLSQDAISREETAEIEATEQAEHDEAATKAATKKKKSTTTISSNDGEHDGMDEGADLDAPSSTSSSKSVRRVTPEQLAARALRRRALVLQELALMTHSLASRIPELSGRHAATATATAAAATSSSSSSGSFVALSSSDAHQLTPLIASLLRTLSELSSTKAQPTTTTGDVTTATNATTTVATNDIMVTPLPIPSSSLWALVNHARASSSSSSSLSSSLAVPVVRDTLHAIVMSSVDHTLPLVIASSSSATTTNNKEKKKASEGKSKKDKKDGEQKVVKARRNSIDGVAMDLRVNDTITSQSSTSSSSSSSIVVPSVLASSATTDDNDTLLNIALWTCDVMAAHDSATYITPLLCSQWLDWIRRVVHTRVAPALTTTSGNVNNEKLVTLRHRLLHAYRLILQSSSSLSTSDIHHHRCALFSVNASLLAIQQRMKAFTNNNTNGNGNIGDASLATLLAELPNIRTSLPSMTVTRSDGFITASIYLASRLRAAAPTSSASHAARTHQASSAPSSSSKRKR